MLNLSQCSWVTRDTLKKIAERCPGIQELHLCSDNHLTFAAWGELESFKQLRKLDLSRCHQIKDDDLVIIVMGSPGLIELSLEGCQKIDDKGFFALSQKLPRLIELNLERCNISDAALIDLAIHCKNLKHLNLSRCGLITNRGFTALAKYAKGVQVIGK